MVRRLVLCAALVLMLPARGSRWIPCGGMWQGYRAATKLTQGSLLLGRLWKYGPHAVPSIYTEAPSPRIQRAYRSVIEAAAGWDLRIQPPTLVQTTELVGECLGCLARDTYATYFPWSETILIDASWADRMTEQELLILVAHEFGHAVDVHMGRESHWALRRARSYTAEQFADYVARLLVDPEAVTEFNWKYG